MDQSEYISYRGALSMNRDVFFLNHRDFVNAYELLHAGLNVLTQGLRAKRDAAGKSHVSFIPFLALMQRQALSGFDHLASHQAYQAWTMVRPAIEIPLIMGKWIDNWDAADVWMRREDDPKPYQREYSGKNMRSDALPKAVQIQTVLKTLNDQFVHPNPYYYYRHLQMADAGNAAVTIEVDYFDDQNLLEPHVLAFLHLLATVHDSVRQMLTDLVGAFSGSIETAPLMESKFRQRVDELANDDVISKRLLGELGCWPKNAT